MNTSYQYFLILERRIFYWTLMTSLVFHGVLVLIAFLTNIHYKKHVSAAKDIEVVYQAIEQGRKQEILRADRIQTSEDKKKIEPPKTLIKPKLDVEVPFKPLEKAPAQIQETGRILSKPLASSAKRQIAVPLLQSEKITNPRYLTYHEQVRDKIRNRAYFYVDSPRFEAGEVYLTFVLSSDGELKDVQIIHERSRANAFLKSVGLRSIKESAPFPPFPKDLKYPDLTFNVVISFEVGD